jgi:hypothetical protein
MDKGVWEVAKKGGVWQKKAEYKEVGQQSQTST